MKLLKNLRNRVRKTLVNNDRGQGATEYILLLVVVVGLVLAFKKPIKERIDAAMGKLGSDMESVTNDN